MTDDRATLADRLAEAGIATDERFIKCVAGEKRATDHDTRYSDPPASNYGVYAEASDRLVELDIDDYEDGAETDGLLGLTRLPPTLEVGSPHAGTHQYYAVEVSDDGRLPAAVLADEFGAQNPKPSWGEVRVANQYVVGPGSQLDGCEKDGCDACAEPDGGYYELQADRPIATISAEALVDALRADPNLDGGDEPDASADPAPAVPDDVDGRLQTALDTDDKLARLWRGDYSEYGGDRSRAECALAQKLGWWVGNDKRTVRQLLDKRDAGKWADRTDDTYRESVLEAVDRNDDCYSPGGEATPPSPELTGEAATPTAQADGGATAAATPSTAGGPTPKPSTDHVKMLLGVDEADGETLDDYNDRKKAAAVWESVRQSDEVYIRVREDNQTLWAYDGGVWTRTGEQRLQEAARQAVGPMHFGANLVSEVKAQARADPTVKVSSDEFGLPAGEIAVENGVVDLRAAADGGGSAACRELRPEDYALTRLPVRFDPEADSEYFAPFVDEVVEDGMADTVQEYIGYCLHRNEMPFAKALMCVGSGANGKSTFLNVVRELLGDDVASTPLRRFRNSHHAAELYGKIANIQGDLSSASLGGGAIGMFKQLTGDDLVSADEKYEDPFTFEPTAKHIYAANTTPDVSDYVDDSDVAWWRRWILVQFPNYYPEGSDKRDPNLAAKITGGRGYDGEMAAVLNWAIEGWGRLMDQGEFSNIGGPAATRREWQRWGESLDEFLVDCVVSDPEGPNVTTGEAWDVYLAWCEETGKDPVDTQEQFTKRLKSSGLDLGFREKVRTDRHSASYGYLKFGVADEAPVSIADGLRFPDEDPEDAEPERDGSQRSLTDTADGPADDVDDSAEALRQELVAILGDRGGEVPVEELLTMLKHRADVDRDAAEYALETAAGDGRLIRDGDVVRIG